MATEFDFYDYIISIDIGTTFSGSCFSYIKDKKSIVHVIRWPEQKPEDTFEKTPTACLYSKPDHTLLKWGKSAMDHITATPDDPDVLLIDQFKLKLHPIFQRYRDGKQPTLEENRYWNAAVDYLREIYQYTCHQLIETVSPRTASQSDFRFVLTVPANWVEDDNMYVRIIAAEAGLIQTSDPKERLVIINEAFAASLFCEREFCIKADGYTKKLAKGQRYLVCDAGGGTVDLATYECTDSGVEQKGHCQLALESGGCCGSTILDQNMEIYLRDQVFLGGVSNSTLKLLVDQFIKEIKHYFGDDSGINNYRGSTPAGVNQTDDATTLTTTGDTEMKDVQEDDYDYEEEYSNHSDDEQEETEQDDSCYDEDDIYNSDQDIFSDNDFTQDLIPIDFVYFTLPPHDKSFIPSVIETLHTTGNIVRHAETTQLRIKKTDISKFVFDPVVEKVMGLVRKQIRISHTTIETLFLLGGFGQSPYLYKKLHYEFITCTNAIQHLIVPEDGYRASMRGGIYHGMDCIDIIPKDFSRIHSDPHDNFSTFTGIYSLLVAIDIDLFDLTATFTFFDLSKKVFCQPDTDFKELLKVVSFRERYGFFQKFRFDVEAFLQNNMDSVVEAACESLSTAVLWDVTANVLYYKYLITAFIHQLYKFIQNDYETLYPKNKWNSDEARYCITVAPRSTNKNYKDSIATEMPMTILKQKILEKMIELDHVFLPEKVAQTHGNICDLFDFKACVSTSDEKELFKSHVYQLACEVGMTKEDSFLPGHIAWMDFSDKSRTRYPYFDIVCDDEQTKQKDKIAKRQVPSKSLEDEKTKILTVDLKLFSQRLLVNNKLLLPASGLHSDWKFQSLSPDEVNQKIRAGHYTVDTLLENLAGMVDFMGPHVHDYIYRDVIKSPLSATHRIGELFFMPSTDQYMFMRLPQGSDVNKAGILYAIQQLRYCEITTKQIRNLLIRPWIKHRLTFMIKAACESFITSPSEKLCVFLTGDAIVSRSKDAPHFDLCNILKSDLKTIFKRTQLVFYRDVDFARHLACLAHGTSIKLALPAKRVTERRYAVHLLTHDIKKQEDMAPYIYSRLLKKTKTEAKEKKDGKKDKKKEDEEDDKYEKILHTIQDGALTLLHTLLDINVPVSSIIPNHNPFLQFKVPHECSIAIVLYASDEVKPLNNTISNNNFKKLHRFIFPIKDISKAIEVSCKVERYELVFTVKQDSYEADYRYVDFLKLST